MRKKKPNENIRYFIQPKRFSIVTQSLSFLTWMSCYNITFVYKLYIYNSSRKNSLSRVWYNRNILTQTKIRIYREYIELEKFYKVMLCSCKSVISSKCYVNLFYSCKAVLYDQSSGSKN